MNLLKNHKKTVGDIAVIAVGSLLYATAVSLFTAPNNIAPGGVTGLATLVNYLFHLPIGAVSFCLNIPLLLIGWRSMGHGFLIRTVAGITLSSLFTDLMTLWVPFPALSDLLLVVMIGGALMGLGLGIIFSRGGTTGGSDIVAKLLERRFPHISIGNLIMLVDGAVIALSAFVYRQVESPLYAVIFVFVCSTIADRLVYGGRRGKMAMIVTRDPQGLADQIMEKIGRGVTLVDTAGAYTGEKRQMLLCAVSREEVLKLKRLTYAMDANAFFMMLTTDEVVGFGWMAPEIKEEK